jgi:DNA-binding IclR family transcriptional regulator
MSIAKLTAGSNVTRQAITKHLLVMAHSGLVHCTRHGRESRWQLDPHSLQEARRYLDTISTQWDSALLRLRQLVES